MAADLDEGDLFEISKLAQQKGASAGLRAYGTKLVADHTKSLHDAVEPARRLGRSISRSPCSSGPPGRGPAALTLAAAGTRGPGPALRRSAACAKPGGPRDHVRTPLDPDMAAHYAEGQEQGRLRGPGRLELARTWELLASRLPPPPAVVLDVGGGPGAYALWLAGLGHEVHLLDPVELHVEQALAASANQPDAPLASARVGDARDLPYRDASADVALLLGPLYHLTERSDREQALREASRVLRPGGLLAAATISRFASTYDGLFKGYLLDPAFERIVEDDLRAGVHRNVQRHPRWFTTAYFHRPSEIAEEVGAAGLRFEALLAVEGPAAMLPGVDAWLDDPERRAVLMRALARVEAEPELLGASPHALALARRP